MAMLSLEAGAGAFAEKDLLILPVKDFVIIYTKSGSTTSEISKLQPMTLNHALPAHFQLASTGMIIQILLKLWHSLQACIH